MRSFHEYLKHRARAFGSRFDFSDLAPQFVPFWESGQRIKVRVDSGEELTGTVEVTTGWKPCFLLMRTTRSIGSPHTLSYTDTIIAVKSGRTYIPVQARS